MINWKKEILPLTVISSVFLIMYFVPLKNLPVPAVVYESLALAQWYAREHVLLCLLPAFFIAGAIAVFVGQSSVMAYLGPKAKKYIAYPVASVAGSVLAVCSCTILPLFAGIYRMGAGLGPAVAFLYAGPAINVMAIILTARVLGFELGMARAIGAIVFSIVIGILMQVLFRKEEASRSSIDAAQSSDSAGRSLWQTMIYFALMVGILVFATWGKPDEAFGIWDTIFNLKWLITSVLGLALGLVLVIWFRVAWWKVALVAIVSASTGLFVPQGQILAFALAVIGLSLITSTSDGECGEWFGETWDFAKKIMPLLFYGVLVAGLLLGQPDSEGLIPSHWIASALGGNGLGANLFASIAGAFMYFATLTEIPILQGLISNGMGKGPALALLLAGPALSLPNMLVIRSVLGTKKTIVYVVLVVIMSTTSGFIYGLLTF